MDRRFLRRAVVVAVVAAALGLVGCGRKGALEPPPSAAVKAVPATDTQPADGTKTSGDSKPDKAFVLDPLLK